MVVVLPVPLTPTTSTTMRLQRRVDDERQSPPGPSVLADLGGEHLFHLRVGDLLVVAAGAERRDDALRGRRAEVGADQRVLEVGDGRGIELPPR